MVKGDPLGRKGWRELPQRVSKVISSKSSQLKESSGGCRMVMSRRYSFSCATRKGFQHFEKCPPIRCGYRRAELPTCRSEAMRLLLLHNVETSHPLHALFYALFYALSTPHLYALYFLQC